MVEGRVTPSSLTFGSGGIIPKFEGPDVDATSPEVEALGPTSETVGCACHACSFPLRMNVMMMK